MSEEEYGEFIDKYVKGAKGIKEVIKKKKIIIFFKKFSKKNYELKLNRK
jgi:hypothetical protein